MAVLVKQDPEEVLARMREVEPNMLLFAEHWKYIPTLPRGPQGEKAILMMDYLVPDLAHIVAGHYISLGWRHHPELAIIKSRRIVGGLMEDLVTYVPVDEPDEPVVAYHPETPPAEASMDAMPWHVKPTVTETFEKRPDDD
jgi:hypothetical protein